MPNNQSMTPQQALALIDQVTGQIRLTRAEHSQVALAIRTLHDAIQPQQPTQETTSK